jgi:hypothetical protein
MKKTARLGSALVFAFGVVLAPMAHRLHHAAPTHGHEHECSDAGGALDASDELLDPDDLLDGDLGFVPELTFGDLLAESGSDAPQAGTGDHHHGELPGRPHGQGSLAHDDVAMGAASCLVCILAWDPLADAIPGPLRGVVPAPPAGLPDARGPPAIC